ncbi:uncharacterized protein Triagg1_1705 [Trichoderma aggressivum f. europaeum]|uniref:Uncharacterized protein n=1 Tax=Trichoderma aggressivum f. europaeum TaxID=173218 RepID=A0AAE1M3R2_9HYPO|nr:hypothetical protein Triagg1_1705 [Trichoderma aggressivum f. europaeum]
MEGQRPSTVFLVIAIIMAVLIFLNILIGIAYLLIPKDCIRCGPDGQPPRRPLTSLAPAYSLRSIFVSGSRGRRVAIINGFVEVDDDFDAWAYWATDSEETLRGIPAHSQSQPQGQNQVQSQQYPYGLHRDAGAGIVSTRASAAGYGYQHHDQRMGIPLEGTVARVPDHRTSGGFAFTEYDFEPAMEYAAERATPLRSHPLARGNEIDIGQLPQTPTPTVRTWGRDSDATIRAVVENPRMSVGGSRPKSYRSEGQASNDPGRQGY